MIGQRPAVWLGTVATAQIYIGAIWLVYEWLVAPRIRERALAVALAFALAQALVIGAMLAALYMRRLLAWRRARRSEQIHAEIEEALALQLVGDDQLPRLRKLVERSRTDVANAIEATLATVRGQSRQQLLMTAKQLDLPVADDPARIEMLFSEATRGNLLRRAVLTEELESHAAVLAEQQISSALTSTDTALVMTALDMIYAWKRVLPIGNLDSLLRHGDASIRARALRALPYIANPKQSTILAGLRDPNPAVRAAAAESAGRLRVDAASGVLEKLLSDPAREVAVAAAFALAVLPDGTPRLQQAVASPDRAAAAVAFEALEKATIGRVELA